MKKGILLLVCLFLALPTGMRAETLDRTVFMEEDHSATGLAAFQDALYLLTDEGVCRYDTASAQTVVETDAVVGDSESERYADRLCADAHGLYAVSYGSGSVVRVLDETGARAAQTVLNFEPDEDKIILSAEMTEQYLCLLEEGGAGVRLRWMDRQTGAEKTQELNGASHIRPYRNDTVAYAIRQSERGKLSYGIGLIDLATGQTESLGAPTVAVEELCGVWKNELVFASKGKLYCWNSGEQTAAELAGIPRGDLIGGTVFGDLAAVLVDSCFAVRDLENTAQCTTLTYHHPVGRSEDYRHYIEAHPEVELSFVGDSAANAEERFVQDMITQSDQVDVYRLTELSLLSSIAEKKMAKDLSDSTVIAGLVSDMYPAFANLYRKDGFIYAVPSEVYLAVPAYRPSFFECFNLPVPTTWTELLELTERWLDEFADEYPDARFSPFDCGLTLDALLRQYEIESRLAGKEVVFAEEQLAGIVSKYLALEKRFEQNPPPRDAEDFAFNLVDLPHSSIYTPLLLSVHADAQPVLSGAYLEQAYLVVNPYGKHVAEATAFAESVCSSLGENMPPLLLQSRAHAVESPDYQRENGELTEKLSAAEEALQSAADDEREQAEERLDELKQELEILQQNRWQVTEEEMALYKTLTDRMLFSTDDPLDALADQLTVPLTQLRSGKMTVLDFLRLLDSKAKMVVRE